MKWTIIEVAGIILGSISILCIIISVFFCGTDKTFLGIALLCSCLTLLINAIAIQRAK